MARCCELLIDQILIYYDEPQLFVARDVVDTAYLCLLYDEEEYVAMKISGRRLDLLKGQRMDVRTAFIHPENEGEYFKVAYTEEGFAITENIDLEERMLPEEGLFLELTEGNEEILQEASAYKRPILHLGFVDKDNSHSIPARDLAPLLSQFQLFVTCIHGKLYGKEKKEDAELRIVNTLAASFNVHFMANEPLDVFGSSDVAHTMEKVDSLLSCETEAELLKVAEELKGHSMSSYKNFLKTLLDRGLTIKLRWTKDEHSIGFRKARIQAIQEWYDVLEQQTELGREIVEMKGVLTSADTHLGKWGLTTEKGETIKGTSQQEGLVDHLTMKQTYIVNCEELLEQKTTAKNPKAKLIALSFTPL